MTQKEFLSKVAAKKRALQMFSEMLTDESGMMEVAELFEPWESDMKYKAGKILSHGVNGFGDVQLYRVVTTHTSAEDKTPDTVPGFYKAIGVTESGIPIWTQPLGGHDAYQLGDVVSHEGVIWVSAHNGNNKWEPGVKGWALWEG